MVGIARHKKTKIKPGICYLWKATKHLLSAKLFLSVGMMEKSKRRCKRRVYV